MRLVYRTGKTIDANVRLFKYPALSYFIRISGKSLNFSIGANYM